MKAFASSVLLLLLALPVAGGDEAVPSREGEVATAPTKAPGVPWIGLSVGQLDEATRAHAPEVPKGAGFLVVEVNAGGPANLSGIRPYDIIWRFDDQLLVNEAQLAVLLQMHRPGDEITLTLVRSGERQEVALKLGEAPAPPAGAEIEAGPHEMRIPPSLPGPGMLGPVTKVYPKERTAEITRDDASVARLWYEGDTAMVTLSGAEGEKIYEGPIREDGEWKVPKEWGCVVGALMRSLHRAEQSDLQQRRPRPRVVRPAGGDR